MRLGGRISFEFTLAVFNDSGDRGHCRHCGEGEQDFCREQIAERGNLGDDTACLSADEIVWNKTNAD